MKLSVESHKKLIVLSFLFFFITGLSQAKDTIKLITNSPINNNGPSKDCNVEICTSLLELINSANKTIDFAIYGLRGQDEILQALINAEKRGVKVLIGNRMGKIGKNTSIKMLTFQQLE